MFDGHSLDPAYDELTRQVERLEMLDKMNAFKLVEIPKADEAHSVPRIPLMVQEQDDWIREMFIDAANTKVVYTRDRFRNSFELIYHNLKLAPDSTCPKKLAKEEKTVTIFRVPSKPDSGWKSEG